MPCAERMMNKVALITGAGSGIGRSGAELFAAEGASVVVSDMSEDRGAETVRNIEAAGGRAVFCHANVLDEDDCQSMVRDALSTYGTLNVVWANAGVPQAVLNHSGVPVAVSSVEDMPVEEFDRIMGINGRGPWLTARAAVPALKAAGGGAILTTGSISGLKGRPNLSAYAAAKGAAVMLTRALANELAPFGIRVNSVCPAAVDTPMLKRFTAGAAQAQQMTATSGIPLGRIATPKDVALAALFLSSDEASFITGVNLPVDGGVIA